MVKWDRTRTFTLVISCIYCCTTQELEFKNGKEILCIVDKNNIQDLWKSYTWHGKTRHHFVSFIPSTIYIYFMQLTLPCIINLAPTFTSTTYYRVTACTYSYLLLQTYFLQLHLSPYTHSRLLIVSSLYILILI